MRRQNSSPQPEEAVDANGGARSRTGIDSPHAGNANAIKSVRLGRVRSGGVATVTVDHRPASTSNPTSTKRAIFAFSGAAPLFVESRPSGLEGKNPGADAST
jgi:hypothetical protein